MKNFSLIILSLLFFSSCSIIRPGEVGVKQSLGKLNDKAVTQPESTSLPLMDNPSR